MIDYNLTRDDCKRLLLEYQDLNAAYEQLVRIDQAFIGQTDQKTNEEFWAEFLAKNLLYQTEPFGGTNPVFIPFRTEEKDYEDRYVHNQHMIIEALDPHAEPSQELLKAAQAATDVNFLTNLELDLREGQGAWTSTTEIDPLYAKIEAIAQSNITQGDLEISKLDKIAAE